MQIFVEFLERSCTAEFSGFLLYKELGRRLKKTNPVVAEVILPPLPCSSSRLIPSDRSLPMCTAFLSLLSANCFCLPPADPGMVKALFV